MRADRALVRTGILAVLLAGATACSGGGSSPSGPGSATSAHPPAQAAAACELLTEASAQHALGLTVDLTQRDNHGSCRYLTPGTLYRDLTWAELRTGYTSVSQAVSSTKSLIANAAWSPQAAPTGLGSGAQLFSGQATGHDSQGDATQVVGFIIAWTAPSGGVRVLVLSELAEDASKSRSVTAAGEIYAQESGSADAATSVAADPSAAASADSGNGGGGNAGGAQWQLTGSCPSAATISQALGHTVKSVTPQDGVACQYHAVNEDIGLDLYTANSLSDERSALDAAHGGVETLTALGPDVQQAYGNGNFFNICSVSAPWVSDSGGVVAEAKDASMKPMDGKALCPAALALFTSGAHPSS